MRRPLVAVLLVGLISVLFWRAADSQPPVPCVRLQGAHTSIADVDHAGALYVTALSPLAVTLSTTNVGQSGAWTIQAAHLAGTPSVSQGSAWAVVAHAQQSGAWTIQAAHLAGIPSISQGTAWSVLAHAQQSGSWTIQAAHQGGQWTVAHVTSVTHVRGAMQLVASYGQVAFLTHFGALAVTCYTNAGVPESCSGSGGSADAVNVFHQSTIRHISSVTHVAIVQGSAGGASHLLVAPVYQAGTWTVQPGNTANTTAWLANVQHVSSTLHVAVVSRAVGIGKTITYVSVNQSAAGTTTLAVASVGNLHKVLGAVLTMSLEGTLKFTDGVGDLTGPMDVATTGGFVLPTSVIPYQQTAATNRALNLVTTLGAARGVVILVTEP